MSYEWSRIALPLGWISRILQKNQLEVDLWCKANSRKEME